MIPIPPFARERRCLDRGWRFAFGHPHDRSRDHGHGTGYFSHLAKAGYGDGPAAPDFDDRTWRELDLPHDWAVELPFSKEAGHSHGYRMLGRDFPEHSVAWYRRRLELAVPGPDRRTRLTFDGVFRQAQVFFNGFYLGCEPSGHTSFHHDVTDYLAPSGQNLLVVRVDASSEEGWYYEGAGIYRHVWLTQTHPLHVLPDGVFVSSEVEAERAWVTARTEFGNEGDEDCVCAVLQRVFDADDRLLAEHREEGLRLAPSEHMTGVARLALPGPRLWSPNHPHLYRLETALLLGDAVVDRVETRFGVRSAVFDPDRGFLLNGHRLMLKGTNNHQDHAGLGTALPDSLQSYRLQRLQSFGCNAYRCAHHPPTPELLDACDRLGILVIDENRSMGVAPAQLEELSRMIRRDRNHPSVVLWSLGNEEWAIEGNERGARVANRMQRVAQRLDPTRRVTVAISGGWGAGISSVIDVMGFNYISHGSTDEQHARFPWQPGVGTEETTTQSTRGVYTTVAARGHSAPVLEGTSGGNTEVGWRHYSARPYLAGLFYWTGFDYRGEPNPFAFPAVSSQFGILDTCGFEKDWAHYLRAWWGTEPTLHLMPHWNWPGREGEPISVYVFTNAVQVELLLNGESLGLQEVARDGHLEWTVPYSPGRLEARARTADGGSLRSVVETTGDATALRLEAAHASLAADGCDVAVVTVSATDALGRRVPTAEAPVTFTLRGPGRLLGVGNGDPSSLEPDRYLGRVELIEPHSLEVRALATPPTSISDLDGLEPQGWIAFDDAALDTGEEPPTRLIRATLLVDAPLDGAAARLLPRWFGESQSLYLNGTRLAVPSRRDPPPLLELELEPGLLRYGTNTVTILADRYHDAEQRRRAAASPPLILRLDLPPPAWQRRLFNGLAQVIVQSNGLPGELELEATSPNLAPSRLRLAAR